MFGMKIKTIKSQLEFLEYNYQNIQSWRFAVIDANDRLISLHSDYSVAIQSTLSYKDSEVISRVDVEKKLD
jgi:hypothetical protein